MARNTDGGSGYTDHTGYGPEDHYSAFRGRKICPLNGAPSIRSGKLLKGHRDQTRHTLQSGFLRLRDKQEGRQ